MANRWMLRVLCRGELVHEQPLDRAVTKVGSQAPADVVIDAPSIARLHAVLELEEGGAVEVIDLGAEGGIRVHGERVAKARLHPGDRVALGEGGIEIEVRLDDGVAAPLAAASAGAAPAGSRPWDSCPGCGISLSPEDRARGRCGFCEGALAPAPAAAEPAAPAAAAVPAATQPPPAAAPVTPPPAAPATPGQRARLALYLSLGFAALLSLFSSCLGSCMMERDPFFGQHADLYCPMICKGCHGPYVYLSWSSSSGGGKRSSHLVPYCRTPDKPLERTGWSQLLADRQVNDRYAFPLGIFGMFLAGMLLWLGVLAGVVVILLLYFRLRPRRPVGDRPPAVGPPRRGLRRAVVYALLAIGPGFLISYCASGRVQGWTRVLFWNGRSPLKCNGREIIELRGRRIVTGDAAIQAKDRCQVTLVDTEIHTGEQGIRIEGAARVTLRRSRVRADRVGVWVADRAGLVLDQSRIAGQDGAVHVQAAGTVEGQGARLESPKVAVVAGQGASLRLRRGRVAGGEVAVHASSGARVIMDRVDLVGRTSGDGQVEITPPEAPPH